MQRHQQQQQQRAENLRVRTKEDPVAWTTVPAAAIYLSPVLARMAHDYSAKYNDRLDVILPNTRDELVLPVLEWLRHFSRLPIDERDPPVDDGWVNAFLAKHEAKALGLLGVAARLELTSFAKCTANFVARKLRGKPYYEVTRILGIHSDLSDEEDRQLAYENSNFILFH